MATWLERLDSAWLTLKDLARRAPGVWWYVVAWVSGRRCKMAVTVDGGDASDTRGELRPCGVVASHSFIVRDPSAEERIPLCARHLEVLWSASLRGPDALVFHTGRETFTITI